MTSKASFALNSFRILYFLLHHPITKGTKAFRMYPFHYLSPTSFSVPLRLQSKGPSACILRVSLVASSGVFCGPELAHYDLCEAEGQSQSQSKPI